MLSYERGNWRKYESNSQCPTRDGANIFPKTTAATVAGRSQIVTPVGLYQVYRHASYLDHQSPPSIIGNPERMVNTFGRLPDA